MESPLKSSWSTVYDSSKQKNIAIEELRSVFRYRDLILQLIRRDIVTRYKRSVLGILWTMLAPLGTMLILTVVFSQLFNMRGTYPAYIMTNLIAWNFFAQTTSASLNSMLWGSSLFQRIYLPRTSFVVSAIGTGLVNTLLALVPLVAIFLITRVPIPATNFRVSAGSLLTGSRFDHLDICCIFPRHCRNVSNSPDSLDVFDPDHLP
jgi:ABC-type polysaccharide/polyol phosphate export permease